MIDVPTKEEFEELRRRVVELETEIALLRIRPVEVYPQRPQYPWPWPRPQYPTWQPRYIKIETTCQA